MRNKEKQREHMLTTTEMAKAARISLTTLYRWIRQGRINKRCLKKTVRTYSFHDSAIPHIIKMKQFVRKNKNSQEED